MLKVVTQLRGFYKDLIGGKVYATWDEKEKDFVASNQIDGDTGFYFFLNHWKDIKFKRTNSRLRDEKIAYYEKFKDESEIDKIMVYKLDGQSGKIAANDPPFTAVKAGAGPRHFAFAPDGRHAYVINELDNTIVAFDYDSAGGALKEIQTISTLPEDFTGNSWCAEVRVHPSGKFLYGSNRGHNSIAVHRSGAPPAHRA